MLKTSRLLICLVILGVAGCICTACNKNADLTPTPETQPKDKESMKQQGQGGIKANNGGGMMPQPEPAAPGEKTGIPK